MKRRQPFLWAGVPWLMWAGGGLAHGTRAGGLIILKTAVDRSHSA